MTRGGRLAVALAAVTVAATAAACDGGTIDPGAADAGGAIADGAPRPRADLLGLDLLGVDLTEPPADDLAAPPGADLAEPPPGADLAAPPPPADLAGPPPAPDAAHAPPDAAVPPDLAPPVVDLAKPPPPPDLAPPPDPCGGKPDLARLYNYIEGAVKKYGFCPDADWAVSDLQTGKRAEVPGSTAPHESASSIKAFVLTAVLDDVEHGRYALATPMNCAGQTQSVDACLARMISVSDNCATFSLTKRTTIQHVNAVMKGPLGMATSAFNRWCFQCADWPGYCPNTNYVNQSAFNSINAHDVATALERLYSGKVLPTLTQKAFDYLKTAGGWQKTLGRYVPVAWAHKQGWLPASQGYHPLVENDVGVGFACRPYGANVLIEHQWTNAADDQRAMDLEAQIGRLAYCTFHPAGTASDGQSCAATFAQPPGPPCK